MEFRGTGDCLGFVPSCEYSKWTKEQWDEYDQYRKDVGLPSRSDMGNALKTIYDRLVASKNEEIKDNNDYVSFHDENGNFKSTENILKECRAIWEQADEI